VKKITIGIADDNKDFSYLLSEFVKRQGNMDVIFTVYNGKDCLDMLEENPVDVLILDVVMPQMDGIGVLEEIKKKKQKGMKIIILTAMSEEETKEKAVKLGANYYILKPFDLDMLIKRIEEVHGVQTNKKPTDSIEKQIAKLILKHDVPNHIKGYIYLKDAVMMVYQDPYAISSITKIIYPKIGEKYSTSSSCVERAIRHSIDISWKKKDGKKPKNGEFIARIAEEIRLENN